MFSEKLYRMSVNFKLCCRKWQTFVFTPNWKLLCYKDASCCLTFLLIFIKASSASWMFNGSSAWGGGETLPGTRRPAWGSSRCGRCRVTSRCWRASGPSAATLQRPGQNNSADDKPRPLHAGRGPLGNDDEDHLLWWRCTAPPPRAPAGSPSAPPGCPSTYCGLWTRWRTFPETKATSG